MNREKAKRPDMVIDKTTWELLPDSTNKNEKDEIEQRARDRTLIVKDGQARYRPVEVPEAGWQLEKQP